MNETGIEIVNAVIESAHMRIERGFILDSYVVVNYEVGTQDFGGWVLGGYSDTKAGSHDEQPNLCAEWIVSILRAADVEDWAKLPGKAVRIRREVGFGGKILGIGHITKSDRWFIPADRFAQMVGEKA